MRKPESNLVIAAALLVLFTGMIDPKITILIAVSLLIAIVIYGIVKKLQTRR